MNRLATAFFLVIFICGAFWQCEKKSNDIAVVATVGKERISLDDVVESFALHPKFRPDLKGRTALRKHLDGLVATKLLAAEADKRGYLSDQRIQERLDWVRKHAMVDELYREVVRDKVQVTEDELREAFAKKQTKLHVRHLYIDTLEEAQNLRRRLLAGESFEDLAREVFKDHDLAENGGDLGYFSWGEMDPDFEAAAYSLKVGEISQPVRTRWGYHIIRVDDFKRNVIASENDFQLQRKSIERILRLRKEDKLSARYVAEVMKGLDVRAKGPVFTLLVNHARQLLPDRESKLPLQKPIILDGELSEIGTALEDHLNDVFVTFEGGQWTLGEFLEKVKAMPPGYRPRLSNPHRFREELKDIIRDEFLAGKAEKMKLQSHPQVVKQVNWWRDELLASKMKSEMVKDIAVAPEEIESYFRENKNKYADGLNDEMKGEISYHLLAEKQDSVINNFIERLKSKTRVTYNSQEFEKAFEQVGGENAGFMVVWPEK